MRRSRRVWDEDVAQSHYAAKAVLPLVFERFSPKSVIDVGCGAGGWLRVARTLGAQRVLGIERGETARRRPPLDDVECRTIDFDAVRLSVGETFDLALCLRVAEHLNPARTDGFLQDLSGLSDTVLFCAAIPYEAGGGYANAHFNSYWIQKFEARGFTCFDFLRPAIWRYTQVPIGYRQNILLFSRSRSFEGRVGDPWAADRVHPELWIKRNGLRAMASAATRLLSDTVALVLGAVGHTSAGSGAASLSAVGGSKTKGRPG